MSTRRTLDPRHAALPEIQAARRSWIKHQTRKAVRLLQQLDHIDHRDGSRNAADQIAEGLTTAAGEIGAAVSELLAADLADS